MKLFVCLLVAAMLVGAIIRLGEIVAVLLVVRAAVGRWEQYRRDRLSLARSTAARETLSELANPTPTRPRPVAFRGR